MRRIQTMRIRTVAAAAAAAATLATAIVTAAGAAPGGTLYFWSDRGHPALYSMRADGTRVRLVLRTPQNAKRPVPSPDGRWIAFDGAGPGKPTMIDFDVQIVRRDGTGRRTLVGSAAVELDPQWSPDGSRLSYSRQATGDWRRSWIWLVGRDGRAHRRLTRGQFARWSPDGSLIALDAPGSGNDGDLVIVTGDGQLVHRFPPTPELEQPADWSPDGRWILFTRFKLDGTGADVFVVGADGSGERRLTLRGGENVAAAWSPDGKRVLFTSDRTGRQQLWIAAADGSGAHIVRRTRFDDVATSWG